MRNIVNRKLDFESTKYVTPEYYEGITDSRQPSIGDILYSVVGSYGVPVEVDIDKPFSFQRHIAILKPDRDKIFPGFLRWMLDSPQILDQVHKVVTGSAQKTLTLTYLRRLNLPLPPTIDEQKHIAHRIQSFYSEVLAMESAQLDDSQLLGDMEQSILAQAFRGEL